MYDFFSISSIASDKVHSISFEFYAFGVLIESVSTET